MRDEPEISYNEIILQIWKEQLAKQMRLDLLNLAIYGETREASADSVEWVETPARRKGDKPFQATVIPDTLRELMDV